MKLIKIKEAKANEWTPPPENILKPALNSIKHDNKVTIKRFDQKISKYETKEVSRDDNKWYFIFPVNSRLESKNGILNRFLGAVNLSYWKRLLGIMINPPEIIEIRLNEILDKRHQLAHGGKYDIISRSDFNFLKWKYEKILWFLMDHNNEFKTIDEIEGIYDNNGKTKDELEEEIRVINYLIYRSEGKVA